MVRIDAIGRGKSRGEIKPVTYLGIRGREQAGKLNRMQAGEGEREVRREGTSKEG